MNFLYINCNLIRGGDGKLFSFGYDEKYIFNNIFGDVELANDDGCCFYNSE